MAGHGVVSSDAMRYLAILAAALWAGCDGAPAATGPAVPVLVTTARPAAPPAPVPSPGSTTLLAVAKFHDLFTDIPYEPAFVAQHRIASIKTLRDGEVEREVVFHEDGQVLEERWLDGGVIQTMVTSNLAGGLVRERTYQHRPSHSVTTTSFSYDAHGRLAQQLTTGANERAITFAYEGERLIETVETEPDILIKGPPGMPPFALTHRTRFEYDDQGRLIRRTTTLDGGRVIDTQLHLDAEGRLAEVKRTGAHGDKVDRYPFRYDARGLLAQVTFFEGDKRIAEHLYEHAADGRLLTRRQISHVPAMTSYSLHYTYEGR